MWLILNIHSLRISGQDVDASWFYSLGALAPKIQDGQIGEMADALCKNLLSDKKSDIEKRDVASIGIKTLISEVSSVPAGNIVVKKILPPLISSLQSKVCLSSFTCIRFVLAACFNYDCL